MTNTEILISYDTGRESRDHAAYRVTYVATDAACHELRQIGEVWNNVAHYRGVYPTRHAAEAAGSEYLPDDWR
jgi:hypothetical protein